MLNGKILNQLIIGMFLFGTLVLIGAICLTGCDWFDKYETFEPGDDPNTCAIFPNLEWVDECEYLVTINSSSNCSDVIEYYRWQWESWGWKYKYAENGFISFPMDFKTPDIYRLDITAFDNTGSAIASFFDGFNVDCNDSQTEDDLNLRVVNDTDGSHCGDVLIMWDNTSTKYYNLYIDGELEGVIPGNEDAYFVYGYNQTEPTVEYMIEDSNGNTDDTLHGWGC